MAEYKVNGLDLFAEQFKAFTDNYIIVGGTACYLAMREAGLGFRTTKDIDMIITVEEISHAFGERFWDFIRKGGYKFYEKDGVSHYYRFINPTDNTYPAMLELFSRKQDMFMESKGGTFTPIVIDEEISSLSAIMLDDEYYSFLKSGKELIDSISILQPTHLIAFKAKAHVDLTNKKSSGMQINERDLKKHKHDVFRLVQLLTAAERINAVEKIKNDVREFLALVKDENINMKQLGVTITQEEAENVIKEVFEL